MRPIEPTNKIKPTDQAAASAVVTEQQIQAGVMGTSPLLAEVLEEGIMV